MMDGKSKVKVAMIGAGSMANKVHYPSLASFDDVELAAVCDLNPEALRRTADKYAISGRYADYRQMIEAEAPDAVYAIGPPHVMYDIWRWCLGQGLHLCIEKPLGLTIHQAQSLAYLADDRHCITQVGFQRRSSPMVAALREECLKRGPINHAACKFYKAEQTPFVVAAGRMMDDCVHSIDTLRWMCGGEVVKVESMTRRIGVPDINFISATLHFDNGALGYLTNSWTSGRRLFAVEMHGNNICAEAEHEGKGHLYADGDTAGTEYDAREMAGSGELYVYGGFRAKNRQFIDAVKAGTQPESNFADALKTMAVAETILAQALLDGR